jgi:hypothetical protein
MNGEIVDSWICNLSTYFKASHEMEEETKLHITRLKCEGITQVWWDTQLETFELVIEISELRATTTT